MEILENREAWQAAYKEGWLAHWRKTGETNWKIYNRPNHKTAPSGKGIDLSQSRLLLISSAGGYLPASQNPFDAENDLGDYSIRQFSIDSAPTDIAFAHTHYDHTAVNEDQQVLLPLRHLKEMVSAGEIGELAPQVISFMGYQPDAVRVVDECIPLIIAAAQAQNAQAALLVPS
ncbi:MAG: glycine/sarcosine/betaine reductase selenoprotein B family protein [Ardenticatenaceae bacterium]|nr:glycine/sarcosine/betaine reductase selenoprotein B family protein [Ardenticatenaceae bacterium]